MKMLWRWLRRGLMALLVVILCLIAPVAFTEMSCHPVAEPKAYDAILPPEHHRAETRTLMTYPEWHIVHAYEDYGRVLETGDPHDYGFLKGIAGFWGSLCALSKASGAHGDIDGATKQMVYVIGVSFTAELLLKAAYEETLGRVFAMLRGEARAPLDELSAAQAKDYATFLQQTPWYKWDFQGDRRALADAATSQLRDRERRVALGLEYGAKAGYAQVIAAAVSQVGPDALTLRMIVTGAAPDVLSTLEGVTVIGSREGAVELETIRYRALTHLMVELADKGVEFTEIAGNDEIMLTILSDKAQHPSAIYSRQRQGFDDFRHLLLIPVESLAETLRGLQGSADRLEHVHDY